MRHRYKQLEKEGWIHQFIADEAQAKDAVEIYDLLGYEVHLQSPKHAQSKKKGSASSAEIQSHYKIVYIRPRK
jgi:hypothetical protein